MKNRIKSSLILLLAIFIISIFAGPLYACDNHYYAWRQVGERAANECWQLCGGRQADILVFTNAGYAVESGSTTEACLDGLTIVTACTNGQANLMEVHSSWEANLWFFVYNKVTGNGAYCQINPGVVPEILASQKNPSTMPSKDLFTKLVCKNIAADKLLANPEAWNKQVKGKIFGGNEFRITTLANLAAQGAPYDFMNACLFHDHACPGVTSGYFLAEYLTEKLPLRSPQEKYYVISTPCWCKDDALQVVLNTTPGKRGMAVIPIANRDILKPEAKNMAGIFFRWDSVTKKGEGVVLGYDFKKATALSGIDLNKGFGWETRLKSDLWYLDYFDKPETFVETIKSFELKDGEVPADYAQYGVSPLIKLDLLK